MTSRACTSTINLVAEAFKPLMNSLRKPWMVAAFAPTDQWTYAPFNVLRLQTVVVAVRSLDDAKDISCT